MGNRWCGGRASVGNPFGAIATFGSGVSMPLDAVLVIRTVTEVPGGTFKDLGVADLKLFGVSFAGFLEMTDEGWEFAFGSGGGLVRGSGSLFDGFRDLGKHGDNILL